MDDIIRCMEHEPDGESTEVKKERKGKAMKGYEYMSCLDVKERDVG